MQLFIVDAFADAPFEGNPAGVCLLESGDWPHDAFLQAVAAELNLSETAFVRPLKDGSADFGLRWLTPTVEVELCGHATLASTFSLLDAKRIRPGQQISFSTRSGVLRCSVDEGPPARVKLDLPAEPLEPHPLPEGMLEALGLSAERVVATAAGPGHRLVEVASQDDVDALAPDFRRLAEDPKGPIVTSRPADERDGWDFVSRYFAPAAGIDEDPVTGAAHCALAPYWAAKLGKNSLVGRQRSRRGGTVDCVFKGDRVQLTGGARIVVRGALVEQPAGQTQKP